MKYEDLNFHNNGDITVYIKYSKTDQKGEGRNVLLGYSMYLMNIGSLQDSHLTTLAEGDDSQEQYVQ